MKAVRALLVKFISIDLLVYDCSDRRDTHRQLLGSLAAVTFLFAIGHALEAGTMNKTRAALAELVAVAPDVAVVMRDGEQVEIAAYIRCASARSCS